MLTVITSVLMSGIADLFTAEDAGDAEGQFLLVLTDLSSASPESSAVENFR